MKPNDGEPRRGGFNRRSSPRIAPLPLEWMDPMSWRLPSGKALAEFALQAGFLAPLILGTPGIKPRKKVAPKPTPPAVGNAGAVVVLKQGQEVPDHSGTFRQTR
jgi:hypothetical protein